MDYITAWVAPVFMAGVILLLVVLILALILLGLESRERRFIRFRG